MRFTMTITFENTSFNLNELKKKIWKTQRAENDFWALWLEFFEWGIRKNWSHGDEDHTLSLQICKGLSQNLPNSNEISYGLCDNDTKVDLRKSIFPNGRFSRKPALKPYNKHVPEDPVFSTRNYLRFKNFFLDGSTWY